jgi:hypothetical protein
MEASGQHHAPAAWPVGNRTLQYSECCKSVTLKYLVITTFGEKVSEKRVHCVFPIHGVPFAGNLREVNSV